MQNHTGQLCSTHPGWVDWEHTQWLSCNTPVKWTENTLSDWIVTPRLSELKLHQISDVIPRLSELKSRQIIELLHPWAEITRDNWAETAWLSELNLHRIIELLHSWAEITQNNWAETPLLSELRWHRIIEVLHPCAEITRDNWAETSRFKWAKITPDSSAVIPLSWNHYRILELWPPVLVTSNHTGELNFSVVIFICMFLAATTIHHVSK